METIKLWLIFAAVIIACPAIPVHALDTTHVALLTPGRQVHAQTTINDTVFDFTLYAPAAYNSDTSRRWPMIIQFPPVGATVPQAIGYGPGFAQLLTVGICQLLNNPANCKNVSDRFIVVSPFLRETAFPSQTVLVKDWIKYLFKTYRIDSTCVSYYGTCWGGNFGYSFATAFPELPSALVLFDINGQNSPGSILDLTKACLLKNISMRAYSASRDPYAPWQNAQEVVNQIDSCTGGGHAEFILENTSLHEIYNYLDTSTALYDWMLAQGRAIVLSNLTADPASFADNAAAPVTFSVRVAGKAGISFVSIDLSPIGGAAAVQMTKGSGDTWTVVFTLPQNVIPGSYYLTVKAVDNAGVDESGTINVRVMDHAKPVLVSIGMNAVASSTQEAALSATAATDGNVNTRWSSAFSDPQWIYVDLGSSMSVTGVVLKWQNAYGRAYQIQVSGDAGSWTDVYSTTTSDGGTDSISFAAASARYVRMYGTQRATSYGYSLFEFEIYAQANSSTGRREIATHPKIVSPAIVQAGNRLSVNVQGNSAWTLEVCSLAGQMLNAYAGNGPQTVSIAVHGTAGKFFVARLINGTAETTALLSGVAER